jgi:hypothetical protein
MKKINSKNSNIKTNKKFIECHFKKFNNQNKNKFKLVSIWKYYKIVNNYFLKIKLIMISYEIEYHNKVNRI